MNAVSISLGHLSLWFIGSSVMTLLLLIMLYPVSFKLGLVDYPGGRKKHNNAVPLIGGIAVFIGASVLLFQSIPYSQVYLIFWSVCFVLVLLSVMDDLYGLKPSHRLILQFILVCIIVVFGATNISNLGDLLGFGDITLGQLSLFFTVFSLVGIMNAVNMMDGVDGLTGCVSLVEFGCLLFLSITSGATTEALIIVIIMGTIAAFLLFNFPSKFSETRKVFLGDAGSMLMGLTLAWLCVRITLSSHSQPYPPVLMLWIMALPLMDTLHLMINRKLRGVSPFMADRRHIHHILIQLQYSARETVLILTALALIIGATGILLCINGASEWFLFAWIIILFCIYSALAYSLKKRVSRRKYKLSVSQANITCAKNTDVHIL